MSNGPYGQIACGCGGVSLLVCGDPLGGGLTAGGEAVAFWPLSAIQLGQGAEALARVPAESGGEAWACRHCDECLLHAHDEADVAVLEGDGEAVGGDTPTLSPAQRRCLEALGYRMTPAA